MIKYKTKDKINSKVYICKQAMKIQTNEIYSSAIHPEQSYNILERKTDVGSQLGESVIGHELNQGYEQKADLKSVTEQLYKETPHARKWYIVTGVLTIWLLASIGLNIYFGIKSSSHPEQKVVSREIIINYSGNCSDLVYEISIPNISGKRVMMNVTHWPDCFIERNFPKSGNSHIQTDAPSVNQLTPPPPNNTTNGTRPLNNQTKFSSDTDNLIYIDEHKIAIVAWAYKAK